MIIFSENITNNKGPNGRVNLLEKIDEKLNLQDKIPVVDNSTDFREALNGGWETSLLSKVFFCKENIQIIQNGIRSSVNECTGKIIDQQPIDIIKIIMRSVYLQNAKNLASDIRNQVKELNRQVIKDCAQKIVVELDSYLKYKRDISNLAVPINRPKSTYKNQVIEFKGYFEKEPDVIIEKQNISKFFENNVEIQKNFKPII
tara:strand:- start:12 stop:617 length:606 start_codon:yes stop_codon:yes gene_type:complete